MKIVEFRIPVICDCGARIVCKTRVVSKTKSCPTCRKAFIVPHPEESFWIVLPGRELEFYKLHAEAVWDYAAVLKHTPSLLIENLRRIRKTLMDISVFASSHFGDDSDQGAVENATMLERLSRGSSFASFSSPHQFKAGWKAPEQQTVVQPMIISFVADKLADLRILQQSLSGSGEQESQRLV